MDLQNIDQNTLILIGIAIIVIIIISMIVRKSKEKHIKTEVTDLEE